MLRTLYASTFSLIVATMAQAHFVFVVPEKNGSTAQVVLSDDLGPDENVPVEKIKATVLHLITAGKSAPLSLKAEKHSLVTTIPGSGNRILVGLTDYGVMQKGDAKPYLLRYLSKAVIGDPFVSYTADKSALEVAAVGKVGEFKFLVTASGKPIAETEVNVMMPDGTKQKVKTDKQGFTPIFKTAGRYGVWTKISGETQGEFGGKKYEEIRTYATLVIDVPETGK